MKIALSIAAIVAVAAIAALAYGAVQVARAFHSIDLVGPFASPGAIAKTAVPRAQFVPPASMFVATRVDFVVTITEGEANEYLSRELGADAPLRDVTVSFDSGFIKVSGYLKGGDLSLPFHGTVTPNITKTGQLQIDVSQVNAGGVPLPGFVGAAPSKALQQMIDESIASASEQGSINFTGLNITPDRLQLSGKWVNSGGA